jgi:hypothetical protein
VPPGMGACLLDVPDDNAAALETDGSIAVAKRVSPSRNDHRSLIAPYPVEQARPLTAHTAATEKETERLKVGFYTVLVPLVATRMGSDKSLEAIGERLQQSVHGLRRQEPAAIAWRSGPASPLTSVICCFFAFVFVFGAVVCELVFAAVGNGWLSGPIFDRVGVFCLGLTAAAIVLLWLWLRPHVNYIGRTSTWILGPLPNSRQMTAAPWRSGSRSSRHD